MQPKLCYERGGNIVPVDTCLEGYNEDDCTYLSKGGTWENCKSGKLHSRYNLTEKYPNHPSYSEGEIITCSWCNYNIDDYYELKDGEHECPHCEGVFRLETECIRRCTTYRK